MYIIGGGGYRGTKISTIQVFSNEVTLARYMLCFSVVISGQPALLDEEETLGDMVENMSFGRVYWTEADTFGPGSDEVDNKKQGKNQLRDRFLAANLNLDITPAMYAINPSLLVHASVAQVA
jgi:hypothetical protein